MNGICTLANDYVFDQVVALLNSIETIYDAKMPVCIYPYDDRIEKLTAEIANRPLVQIYDDSVSMERWDNFAKGAWDTHPTAKQRWQKAGSNGYHRFGTHRRYCAFDGPFERFIYMDADTILMSPLDYIFDELEDNDCVVYDFQHKDPTHIYEVSSPKLNQVFPPERVKKEIFCSGFFASKKDLFSEEKRNWLLEKLGQGESEIIYPMAVDQPLLNYMMMRCGCKINNLAFTLPQEQKTGCCVTSSHFENKDNILYDKGNRLTYIHYIGISSQVFKKVCKGENIDFPYRDIFLYYRYYYHPENLPKFTGKPVYYQPKPSLTQKILKKLGIN